MMKESTKRFYEDLDKAQRNNRKEPKVIHLDPAPGYKEDDDSDGALWAALRHHRKKNKMGRIIHFEKQAKQEIETAIGQQLKCREHYHYQFYLNGEIVDYWPSTNHWRYHGRSNYGNTRSLINWYLKRKKD